MLKGGCIFNSFTGEWEIGDVAIVGETIAGIGSYSGKKEIDVTGKYVTPGLMDSHLHIESTMVAPRELAKFTFEWSNDEFLPILMKLLMSLEQQGLN